MHSLVTSSSASLGRVSATAWSTLPRWPRSSPSSSTGLTLASGASGRTSIPYASWTAVENIYEPIGHDRFRQLPSAHSHGDLENPESKAHDLGGKCVLTAREFSYFGSDAIPLPEGLESLIVGRAHRCRFPDAVVEAVDRWRQQLPQGVQAAPHEWRDGDRSWRKCQ
jgi:hypothetical protein